MCRIAARSRSVRGLLRNLECFLDGMEHPHGLARASAVDVAEIAIVCDPIPDRLLPHRETWAAVPFVASLGDYACREHLARGPTSDRRLLTDTFGRTGAMVRVRPVAEVR